MGIGKFDTALDEAIYGISLDGGPDEEVGSSTEAPGTWAGIMRDGGALADRMRDDKSEFPNITAEDLKFLRDEGEAGVILTESTQGFVSVSYYADEADMEKDWKEAETELGGYLEGDEEEGELEPNAEWEHLRFDYADPGAAHERAVKLKREGAKGILIEPHTEKGRRMFVLKAMRPKAQASHRPNTSIADRRKAGIIEGLTKAEMDSMEIKIPTFDWKQIAGDVNPGAFGGMIAQADGDSIEVIEIQPVREYVGDGEAKDVGFPFWSKEGTYDLDDLSLSNEGVQSAIDYTGLGSSLLEMTPEQRAVAIAEACVQAGHRTDEGPGGWAKDVIGNRKVVWWGSNGKAEGYEYIADEDDEFKREVLEYKYDLHLKGSDQKVGGPYETVEEAIDAASAFEEPCVVINYDTDEIEWDEEGDEEHEPNARGSRRRLAQNPERAGRTYTVLYIHKISSSYGDSKEGIWLPDAAFSDSKTLGKALRDAGVLMSGARVDKFRVDGNKVVVFPSVPGLTTYWYSLILEAEDGEPLLAPNARRHRPNASPNARRYPTLAEGNEPLSQLLDMAAESMDPSGRGVVPDEVMGELSYTDELIRVVNAYEDALRSALEEVVEKYPPNDEATAEDLFADEAPYLVLMTLRGAGVGIWDGDWDAHYDSAQIKKVEALLKQKLGRYADGSGSGSIQEALEGVVWEAMRRADYTLNDEGYVPLEEGEETGYEFQDTELTPERAEVIADANGIPLATFWGKVGGRRPLTRGAVDAAVSELGGKYAKNSSGTRRWNVFLNNELLEPVYMPHSMTADEVKQKLVTQQGYDHRITVDQPPDRRTNLPPHYKTSLQGGKLRENRAWSRAEMNELPDSAFLYIEPGGSEDASGKTVPRALRHFPYKDASGKVDVAHLRNALSRIPQAHVPETAKRAARAQAEKLLSQQHGA